MRLREEPRFVGRRDGATTVHFCHYSADKSRLEFHTEPLKPRFAVFADAGFDWGYLGTRPENLAIALLARYFEHIGFTPERAGQEAIAVAAAFKVRRIAQIQTHTWSLTVTQISDDLVEIDAARYGARRKESSDV